MERQTERNKWMDRRTYGRTAKGQREGEKEVKMAG